MKAKTKAERVYGVFNCKAPSYSNGVRLQRIREKMGLNFEQMARLLRCNRGLLCMYENGTVPIPLMTAVVYEALDSGKLPPSFIDECAAVVESD